MRQREERFQSKACGSRRAGQGDIRAAYRGGASDIHYECDRSGVSVKFRLDGVMSSFARLEGASQAQEVVSRIKVLAQLDITERRLPQDGRFRYLHELNVGEPQPRWSLEQTQQTGVSGKSSAVVVGSLLP